MSEDQLIQIRRDKHLEANQGTYPLAASNDTIDDVIGIGLIGMLKKAQIKTTIDFGELIDQPEVVVHGRVTAIRKTGAITFIKVKDSTDAVQILASRNALSNYDKLYLLDLGYIVEFTGKIVYSKSKELSVLLSGWKILAKALRPPPEKFHGIADTELKYRKRHLDLMSSAESMEVFKARSYIIQSIRSYYFIHNFMEVETSTLNVVNSGANAKPFTTHHNALDLNLNLRIAPELYLKRLIVGGFDKVFEIGRAYRNEGLSTRHNPEFTILESYSAYGNFDELLFFAEALIKSVDKSLEHKYQHYNNNIYQSWLDKRTFSLSEFKKVPMWDAVIHACAKAELLMDPTIHICAPSAFDKSVNMIQVFNLSNERLKKINIKDLFHQLQECSTTGEVISTMFEYVAEPFLTEDYRTADDKYSLPVFITDYPVEICPLARISDLNPNICERFELFIDGRELCNAFQELNDPNEQRIRFQEQLENNKRDAMDIDNDYVEALEHGMPPTIGFGMGIDRLVMLFTGSASIKDVILFPTLKPVR